MRAILAATILAATILAFCAAALSQPPTPSTAKESETPNRDSSQHQSSSGADQSKSDRASVIVNVGPATYANQVPKEQPTEQNKESAADWWIVIPTWLLAIFTGGLLAYTARLWSATNRLVVSAKDTAKRQLRAYAFARSPVIIRRESDGQTTADIVVKNSGQTPAYQLTTRAEMIVTDATVTDPQVIFVPLVPASEANVPPAGRVVLSVQADITDEDWSAAVIRCAKVIHVVGEIGYNDVFGCRQTERFQFMYGGTAGTNDEGRMYVRPIRNQTT